MQEGQGSALDPQGAGGPLDPIPLAGLGLAVVLVLLATSQARADYGMVSPDAIDFGQLVIQHDGDTLYDRRSSTGGAQGYTVSVGTGLTRWWDFVVELGYDHGPANEQPSQLTQAVVESTFELVEPGSAFIDTSVYVEYGQTVMRSHAAGANEFTIGPAIGKDVGPTTHTLNLFVTRLLGPDQGSPGLDFSYAWQSRWNVWGPLSPAVELYGDAGTLGHMPRFAEQQLLIGPVALGSVGLDEFGLGSAGRLKYEIGWLFGATRATAAGTLRWHLELEIPF